MPIATRHETYGGLVEPTETLDEALRRLERRADYHRVIGTDAGQALLEAIAVRQRRYESRPLMTEAELLRGYGLKGKEGG